MKKLFTSMLICFFLILNLCGCGTIGDKNGSLSNIYIATATLSLLLLAIYLCFVRKKNIWFITLFSSVLVVNAGYAFLSISSSLEMALWANRISYLGSVFLPMSMLMIILNVTNQMYPKRLPRILLSIAILIFLITASPGILPIYYKEVSFAVINGVSTLIKIYGPLHLLYLFYLLGYFSAMIGIIIHAQAKKTVDTPSHAIIIAIAVFVNIGVWFIEQLVSIDFEILSVSYIISELFLLGVHLVMNENQQLREIVKQVESVQSYSAAEKTAPITMLEKPIKDDTIAPEQIQTFINGLKSLTPMEKAIYDAYIARVTTKEIMASFNIKESTLKYHNRNLYGKLNVSTRKELLELHKYIKSLKEKLEEETIESEP